MLHAWLDLQQIICNSDTASDEAGAGGQGRCHQLTLTFVIRNTGPKLDKRPRALSPQLAFEDQVVVLYLDIL